MPHATPARRAAPSRQTTAIKAAPSKATAKSVASTSKVRKSANQSAPPASIHDAPIAALPLSRLILSPSNVRVMAPSALDALADSIATVGLLQNLVVVPVPDSDRYAVVAGGRRLRALQLLVERGTLPATHEVRCKIIESDQASLASLTENVQREAMHPADEFAAFAKLVEAGRSIESVAAAFGVTPAVVNRRLKLAAISPRLMNEFRAGRLDLDQMMALTLSDDHAAQEAAIDEAPEWGRSARAIRERLLSDGVPLTDRRACFVGLDAYRAAGGALREDLFAEHRDSTYLTDVALLDRLTEAGLKAVADSLTAEGWKWVMAKPTIDYRDTGALSRVPRVSVAPSVEQAERIEALNAAIADLDAQMTALVDAPEDDEGESQEDEAQEAEREQRYGELDGESERLSDELEALRDSLRVVPADASRFAGALVSLDRHGVVTIERGWLRKEDVAAFQAHRRAVESAERAGADHDGEDGQDDRDEDDGDARPRVATPDDEDTPAAGLPSLLARELSAYRTAALQLEVARRPHTALAMLVDQLVRQPLFGEHFGTDRCGLTIRPSQIDPLHEFGTRDARPSVETTFRQMGEALASLLPARAEDRFDALVAMSTGDLLDLLAFCVGASIEARITKGTDRVIAAQAAEAVSLQMTDHWSATVATYFGQVTKKLILEAVAEFAPAEVTRLAAMKRKEMAEEAAKLAEGNGWLPPALRRPLRRHESKTLTPSASIDGSIAVADDKLDADRDDEADAA